MNIDDVVANVRAALGGCGTGKEVKMFGGIGFMLQGNMVAAVSKRGLLLRVGKDRQADALARRGVRQMEMRGRAMEGYVYVDPATLSSSEVHGWLKMAEDFVRTLPPKEPRSKPKRAEENCNTPHTHHHGGVSLASTTRPFATYYLLAALETLRGVDARRGS